MERIQRFTRGVLLPEDVDTLRQVFAHATSQPWFDPHEYSREGFAARLMLLFRHGIVDPVQLQGVGLAWARKDFHRNMTKTQRRRLSSLYDAKRFVPAVAARGLDSSPKPNLSGDAVAAGT